MRFHLRHLLFYYLPLAANLGLVWYLFWAADFSPAYRHQRAFETFALFYAIGGVVVAVSGITAFLQISSSEPGDRRLLVLALVNAIIPTLLLLILLHII